MAPFQSLGTVFYSNSIVTIVLSCIISEKKIRYSPKKSRFFHKPVAFDAPLGGSRLDNAIPFGTRKLQWGGYPTVIED